VNFALTRKLIIFGLVLPLAAIVGFFLATPQDFTTFLFMGALTSLLLLPIMLKWYHPLLIFSWNAWINVYFLPGKPQLWMLFTAIGFGIVVLNSSMDRERRMIHVPAITIPLLFFMAVVMVTAKLTGGFGVRALGGDQIGGSSIGGKGYFSIIFGILGYFVLTSRPMAAERVNQYVSLFFLSGATGMLSNLAYMLGPAFYFLFYLFPIDFAVNQAVAELSFGGGGIVRIGGMAMAGSALYFMIMARFGIVGIMDVRKWWRLLFFLAGIIITLFGGFRTLLLTFFIHFFCQFYFERLMRTRLAVAILLAGICAATVVLPFLDKMPASVQRCVAIIPGAPVSLAARADAEGSTRWRTEMWQVLLPDVPKYLLIGKGYALSPSELYLAGQAERLGLAKNYEISIVSGAYHNGPLSLIIPFGIFGVIGFLWLLGAGIWVLYRNYRYGDDQLKIVNTFFLSFFIMRTIIFFFVFGAVDSELYKFTGILGLSLAINRGVRKPVENLEASVSAALQPAPA
jgi:hypothetical protein